MASFLSRALGLAPIIPVGVVVGSWEGEATVPLYWFEIGHVYFEFRGDGTYSAHSSGDLPALYVGSDDDSPLKVYEFWGPIPGSGEIAVVWANGVVQSGRIENVRTQDDELSFELWNDWGKRPPYGPVSYALTRVEP
jgi:hypothetical protein